MARANRHYIPGCVWHITHRCHKKEFLLKFSRDRRQWLQWLFQAKKRFGISILNYTVTSNHIHLLVRDSQGPEVIPQSMQLIAGRTGQENIKTELGSKAIGRQVFTEDSTCQLKEPDASYNADFDGKNTDLRPDNTYFWNIYY